ncbi:hypothetical protein DFJ58DRAFT_797998, partial [Suillus subalutaceus]|uniref:uncharacterized protein n=1 Tax=Suillus subalutaceus TaxID=48586 RepID=UPI001B868237
TRLLVPVTVWLSRGAICVDVKVGPRVVRWSEHVVEVRDGVRSHSSLVLDVKRNETSFVSRASHILLIYVSKDRKAAWLTYHIINSPGPAAQADYSLLMWMKISHKHGDRRNCAMSEDR